MYEVVKQLVGDLPTEFEFIYSILTLLLSSLVITFLFQVFYIPLNLVRKR